MNIRRGLLRLWIVASVAWLVIDGWALKLPCTFGAYSAPWCVGWERAALIPSEYARIYLELLGVPLIVLIAGAALFWAINGFADSRRSN
jgi:hypothetical protein